jgi:hypothetical protein
MHAEGSAVHPVSALAAERRVEDLSLAVCHLVASHPDERSPVAIAIMR